GTTLRVAGVVLAADLALLYAVGSRPWAVAVSLRCHAVRGRIPALRFGIGWGRPLHARRRRAVRARLAEWVSGMASRFLGWGVLRTLGAGPLRSPA
ncbi:hypothetical protein, partial [Streptomyces sp. NPDC001123]